MKSVLVKKLIYSIIMLLAITVLAKPAYAQLEEMIYSDVPYGVNLVDYQVTTKVATKTEKPVVAKPALEHYRVKQGDTLWGLANKFGISVDKLSAINGLTADSQLFMGQVIDLPITTIKHTVKSGETLIGICNQYGISMAKLLQANNINNPNLVKLGQVLIIPTGDNVAMPASAAVKTSATKSNLPVMLMNWPVEGRISSEFGIRGDEGRPHEGIDIAANHGALIKAPQSGEVVYSGYYGTYGNTVIIDHGDSTRSLYAHCSRLLVRCGERVQMGDSIAKVGNTGRSFGPHLHWEVTYKGVPYDPIFSITASTLN